MQNIKSKTIVQTGLMATLAFLLTLTSILLQPTKVSAAPFTCDTGFYQIIWGGLHQLNAATGEYDLIGPTGSISTNAIGFNPIDNYIYGWRGNTDGIVRIEDDASTTALGVPTGLPAASYAAADFDSSGDYYILRSGGLELYRVDLSTHTAHLIPLSGAVPPAQEIVYVGGNFYNTNGVDLFTINPTTGLVTQTPLVGGNGVVSIYGGGWAADGSKLFFAHNNSGMIYEITNFTSSNPSIVPVLQGEVAEANDGASCVTARSPLPPLFVTDDTNSTTANTATAGNVISNDSGRDIAVTSYTQPSNGAVTINPDGSYTYTPNNNFVGVDTFTYTITDEYGDTRTATVTITVTAATGVVAEGDEPAELAPTGVSQLPLFLVAVLSVGLAGYSVHGYAKQRV